MTCAYAVRVALKKFQGVDSVDVSLNKGLATVRMNPGNTVRPREMWETIRKNGFTPKQTHVIVRGTIDGTGRKLKVAGTDEEFDLKGDPRLLDNAKAQAGKIVTMDGNIVPLKDVKTRVPLEVKEIRGDQ